MARLLEAFVIAALAAGAAAADLGERLRHDPFDRSAWPPARVAPPIRPDAEPQARPQLRAIVAAGRTSMVNLDGRLLRIGEEADGYRLLEVRERSAVFVHTDRRLELRLAGDVRR